MCIYSVGYKTCIKKRVALNVTRFKQIKILVKKDKGEEGWLSAKPAGSWASGGKVTGATGGAAKTAVKTGAAAGVTTAVDGQVRRRYFALPRRKCTSHM